MKIWLKKAIKTAFVLWITLGITWGQAASAAISRDSTLNSECGHGTSITRSFTNSGGNALVAYVWHQDTTGVPDLTYDSVALTHVGQSGNGDGLLDSYVLADPSTGTHDLVASYGSDIYMQIVALSYSGVDTVNFPDAHDEDNGTTNGTTVNGSLTVSTSDSWITGAGVGRNGFGGGLAGSGDVSVAPGSFPSVNCAMVPLDSNGPLTSGVHNYGFSGAYTGNVYLAGVSIAPSAAEASATPSTTAADWDYRNYEALRNYIEFSILISVLLFGFSSILISRRYG